MVLIPPRCACSGVEKIDGLAGKTDFAAIALISASQDFDQGGFAGAVLPDQAWTSAWPIVNRAFFNAATPENALVMSRICSSGADACEFMAVFLDHRRMARR